MSFTLLLSTTKRILVEFSNDDTLDIGLVSKYPKWEWGDGLLVSAILGTITAASYRLSSSLLSFYIKVF